MRARTSLLALLLLAAPLHTKILVQITARRGDEALVGEFWSAIDRAGLAASVK
jgi:hypothetical protein